MPFPEATRLELPLLLELKATGGSDQPRYIYERLARYFPQLTASELTEKTSKGRNRWHRVVQHVAQQLIATGAVKRNGKGWALTDIGAQRIAAEELSITQTADDTEDLPRLITHRQAQMMIVEMGKLLGKYAEAEFEYFDVVWRETNAAPRLSHVFEVQISGSVDSALTRLKQAFDAQRSLIFLVVADERDQRFAEKRLNSSFHEILHEVKIISVADLQRLYQSLSNEHQLLQLLTGK